MYTVLNIWIRFFDRKLLFQIFELAVFPKTLFFFPNRILNINYLVYRTDFASQDVKRLWLKDSLHSHPNRAFDK